MTVSNTATNSAETIVGLLAHGAAERTALTTPGGVPLTYGGLRTVVADTIASLRAHGIGAGDRVAIVLDNGPEMAVAFLAVGSGATAAPLNPGYRAEEFEFYLTDLRAKLLIVAQGKDSPAIAVAGRLGVPVARLVAHRERGAGTFSLDFSGVKVTPTSSNRESSPDDIALVLHTSGTTSRPKIVPLAQRNVCASAHSIRETLRLTEHDVGLCIMPLFHIHGLIAALLTPLSAGGSVCCSPGFNALKFFSWMEEARPTWYTGVPTMHQAVLMRAPNNVAIVAANRLRFVRSSSSSMPTRVISEIESLYGVPVIEAYGMTEAAHQMSSNPLPPAPRKPGTVGRAAGPAVRVIDAKGDTAPPNTSGEIVIRGDSVMSAYENNPKANAEAFIKGWFRTGDLGTMDAEGYLTISGRLKEIINRGGEKISPREVDEIMMAHPAVHQCVCFAVPHELLGEDVAAAVVLKEGATTDEKELRKYATGRLVDFKVPRKIVILKEIPVGATGKLQRIGLAQKLGLA